ncbi:hypothetical protein EMPG_14861 [Blastomyces silverae]|uniref:BTB domain-containing protein n=1 Tax=Blastomyces silverae TaxID=2060906 RepID=A0A0H1BE13_9EURO|nr:hypothetical protein EMPG_14861 [Blastomyces silverae]
MKRRKGAKKEAKAAELNGTANPPTLVQNATDLSTGALSPQVNPPPVASSFETDPPSNPAWNWENPPIASNPCNTESPTVPMANGGDDPLISSSPYETDIVQVHVGPTGCQRVFHVHLGILNQAPSLSSMISPATSSGAHNSISLVNTDPVIFELVLMFLYIGKYLDCPYPPLIFRSLERDNDNKWPGADMEFEMHSLLYCFAQEYKMDELSALALMNIENMTQVPYSDVLDVAKKAYPKLSDADDDDAYREKFRHETRVAMTENKNLIREPWILDVFRNEHGNLAVDLFTTLTEPLQCDDEANNSETAPPEEPFISSQSDKGEEGNVHLNDGHADYCIQEPTAASVVGEPALPAPEETIAEDIPEAPCEQYPEPLAPEAEPELESAKEPADIVEGAVDEWQSLPTSSKKKKKKGKKGAPVEKPLAEPDDGWGWGISEKNKEVKKSRPVEDPWVEPDDGWGWSMKVKPAIVEPEPEPEPEPGPANDPSPMVDDENGWSFSGTTTSSMKKGKKKSKKKGKTIEAPAPDPESPPAPVPEFPDDPPASNDHQDNPEEEPFTFPPRQPASPAEQECPVTPESPSCTFMLGDADSPNSKARYLKEPCSRRKLHLTSESYWMDCVRCRVELGSIARGIVAGKGGGDDEDRGDGEKEGGELMW